jgi:hypothetical protein
MICYSVDRPGSAGGRRLTCARPPDIGKSCTKYTFLTDSITERMERIDPSISLLKPDIGPRPAFEPLIFANRR